MQYLLLVDYETLLIDPLLKALHIRVQLHCLPIVQTADRGRACVVQYGGGGGGCGGTGGRGTRGGGEDRGLACVGNLAAPEHLTVRQPVAACIPVLHWCK